MNKHENISNKQKEFRSWVERASNNDLIDFFKKTEKSIVPFLFKDEYELFLYAANPKYGDASCRLKENLENISKEEYTIISLLSSEVESLNLEKEKIDFIPLDKLFVQASIYYIGTDEEVYNIDSFILLRDKNLKNVLNVYALIKSIRTNQIMVVFHGYKEEDLTEIKNFKDIMVVGKEQNAYGNTEIDIRKNISENQAFRDTIIRGNKILNIIRYICFNLSTHQYKTYYKYQNGKIIQKEIVYASEVKMHKRHFWKDSGKFVIPTLPTEEILNKGYFIDDLVFKDGELRQNVPYTIIGNHVRNKELEKKNREIDLIKGRILKQEEKIYSILKEIYPDKIIRRHDRKTLKGLELDFNIPELRLGIEYDGEQHFDKELYEKLYGDGFDAQVRRDRQKDKECRRRNIKLVRIKFDEPLTVRHIRSKL